MTTTNSFLNKARKDKFLLVLSPPKALLETAKSIGIDDIQMSIIGSPIPQISVPATRIEFKGQTLNVSSQSRQPYLPLSVDFTIDNDFKNYWFLFQWLNLQNNVENSGMDEYFNNYTKVDNTTTISPRWASKDTVSKVNHKDVINTVNSIPVYHDYQIDLTLFGLDEYNNKKIEFTYTKAFITELGNIQYDYQDSDECRCSAVFEFSQLHAKLVGIC